MGDSQSLGLGGNAVNAHQGCQVQGVKRLLDSRPGFSGGPQCPFPILPFPRSHLLPQDTPYLGQAFLWELASFPGTCH